MTNTELIRQEIERRCEEINSIGGDQYNEFQCGQMHAYGSLRAFIDSLSKETPTPEQAMQSLDEKIKAAKKSWEGVDADEYMDEVRGREER